MFFEALNLWSMTKRWGFPNNVGWFNEPYEVVEMVNTLEDIHIQMENEEQEERMAESKAKR